MYHTNAAFCFAFVCAFDREIALGVPFQKQIESWQLHDKHNEFHWIVAPIVKKPVLGVRSFWVSLFLLVIVASAKPGFCLPSKDRAALNALGSELGLR